MTRAERMARLATDLVECVITRVTRFECRRYGTEASAMDSGIWPLIHDCFAVARGEPAPSGRTDDEVEAEALKERAVVYKAL